ncbi:acyl-CoA dehydrogenase family protein [Rhodococcus sp. AQ5-07]|uniref:acyl-CoA dehydrogenase family protein n=1 Tax=Rhodococcus sp. AQ5-07 TaxID=2054902 RepID=UPI000DC02803|nr:acyl-CoA dehydrogenase family protein [Rhodococcus sp. AQ5-07]RAL30922.1 acyl-CoA dehydrogenase [Rhodococcus sp. AQ5-07]
MTTDTVREPAEVVAAAVDVAAAHAEQVDREGQFPIAAVSALRSGRLLSAGIPAEFGGGDQDIAMLARTTTALSRKCGSTGLIFAMHQSQVASLVRHSEDEAVQHALRRIAAGELLVASATTEASIGGDVRTSSCFVERDGSRFRLEKQAPVISYGRHADIILVTARRDVASTPQEQVLVICDRDGVTLEQNVDWDVLGMRGTCSHGYVLQAEGNTDAVMSTPYAVISAQTMLPVAHILWAAAWLGMAEEAIAKARLFVQASARRKPSVSPPGALRLAEATALLHQMRALVSSGVGRFKELAGFPEELTRFATVVEFNSLKVSASSLVMEIATAAMSICGIAGYRCDGEYSVARILRDAHGAALMVNNDRIHGNSAQLMLVGRTF